MSQFKNYDICQGHYENIKDPVLNREKQVINNL